MYAAVSIHRSAALPLRHRFNMIMIMGGESMSVMSITPHIPRSHMKLEYGRCFDIGWLLLLYVSLRRYG